MDWNRPQHLLQKWQPFGMQQMQQIQQQQQQQIQHQQLQVQHQQQQQQQQHQQPPPPPQALQQQQQQLQPPMVQIPQPTSKISKTGGSATPHCLVCNVHLGMFAKGGMEVFSEEITTTYGKVQIHNILSTIVNQELNLTLVHSSIVCKKCFKLIDDIDALEDKLISMKQVVSSKFTMTLALVKKGMIGKAVMDEQTKTPEPAEPKPKKVPKPPASQEKTKSKSSSKRSRPGKVGRPRKTGNLTVKAGKVVVKGVEEVQEDSPEDEIIEDVTTFVDVKIDDIATLEVTEDSLFCTLCCKDFDTPDVFKEHMELHAVKEEEFIQCHICDKTFLSAESLNKHKKLHKGFKKVKANCTAFDVTHIKQFKCKQCSKVFTTKSKAKDHERTHTGEKPFECDICGTCFRQKSNLSSHKRVTHLQEKRYKCQLCGKAFKWKRLLTGHTMSVHTGERPYRCEFCDAGFVYQQHYKKHMRIHTGEKPFKCEICGKAFNSSNNCRAHMFTHSNKKPYECRICGAGFMRKPLVLSHIKQHAHVNDDIEGYVKSNSPSTAVAAAVGEGNGIANGRMTDSSLARKKKVMREATHTATVHIPQGPTQTTQNTIEEGVPHFIIPAATDNREQTNSGESMGYMFGTFQSQGSVPHYATLNLGQW